MELKKESQVKTDTTELDIWLHIYEEFKMFYLSCDRKIRRYLNIINTEIDKNRNKNRLKFMEELQ